MQSLDMEITAESVDCFVQERGTGDGKTLTLLPAEEFSRREDMEAELRLREPSGERSGRGRKK